MYGDHAYVVSECGPGVQVFDLSAIDSGTVTKVNEIGGSTSPSHNVVIDEASGYLYRVGGSANGLWAYDLNADPTNPPFVGSWSSKYIHDMQAVTYTSGPLAGKQIGFACSGFNGGWTSTGLTILDLTNKNNIQTMDEVFWSNAAYSHQAWLSPDRQYLYLNDELDEGNFGIRTTTHVVDVSDPNNASLVATFDNNNKATGHNLYTRGNRLYEANYRSGLRIFDTTNPTAPTEVAFFDTYEADNKVGYNGLWSTFPFFPSGVVIGSDMEKGLFVFWAEEALLEWRWPAGEPTALPSSGSSHTAQLVELNPGEVVSGSEQLYYDLGSGFQTAPLVDLGGGDYRIDFPPAPCGSTISWYLSAQSQNGITWHYPKLGAARPMTMRMASSTTVLVADDMEVDAGWSSTGVNEGKWSLGDPVGSTSVPEDDHTPSGSKCWETDPNNNVNNGAVTLTSPVYDLSGASNPVVSYWLWYSNNQGAGTGEDPLTVEVSNDGSSWVTAVVSGPSGIETQGDWLYYEWAVSDFVTPGATVQIRFRAEDLGAISRVEAALDDLLIRELACSSAISYCTPGTSASGCTALLSASGTPSASAPSGFVLDAGGVEGAKDGLFFFGSNGRQANTWGNGTSYQCVVPPVIRAGLLSGSGNTGACDGTFSQDLNALWCAGCPNPTKNPGAGTTVQAQLWYRDPLNTSNQTTSLSDAVEFTLAP